jgi:hypothetical protein
MTKSSSNLTAWTSLTFSFVALKQVWESRAWKRLFVEIGALDLHERENKWQNALHDAQKAHSQKLSKQIKLVYLHDASLSSNSYL